MNGILYLDSSFWWHLSEQIIANLSEGIDGCSCYISRNRGRRGGQSDEVHLILLSSQYSPLTLYLDLLIDAWGKRAVCL